jgi:PGF-pre-PGF domain-containing protein
MKKVIILLIILITILIAPSTFSEDTQIDSIVLETIQKDDVGVIIELGEPLEELSLFEKTQATDVELDHLTGNLYVAKVNEEELQDLLEDPNVVSIKEDEIFTLNLADSVPLIGASNTHAKQINGINLTGAGQTVCIIDSGINATHTSLQGRVINQHCFCDVTDLGSGGCCPDNTNEDTSAIDDHGHGTHVAGIVGANGTDKLGVAPGVNLISVKVTNSSGSAFFSDITEGVELCVSNATAYNISAITISLGGGSFSSHCDSSYTSLAAQIDAAYDANVLVTISTGNDGSSSSISSPACIRNAIAVSSTTDADAVSAFSNRNSIADIMAPGSSIVSTRYTGGTETRSGTSMATPHVAGAIALLQQYKQDFEGRSLTSDEVNQTITTNGTSIDDTSASGELFTRLNLTLSLIALDGQNPGIGEHNTSENNNYIYNNITFIANASDLHLETVWLEANWTGSYQNYTMSQDHGDKFNFSIGNDTLTGGQTFQWRIHSNDSKGNENVTGFSETTFLTGAPIITVLGPADDKMTNNAFVLFNFSATDEVNVTFECDLYLNNVLNQTNDSTLNNSVTNFNVTLIDSEYSWFFSCTDGDGLNSNSTARTITIDSTKPGFSGESFRTPIELGDTQSYSLNISDSHTSYANFSYLGSNYSMSNSSGNFSYSFITTQNGTNSFVTYAKDAALNINNTNNTFTVNDSITGPRIINLQYSSSLATGATQTITAYIVNAQPISSASSTVATSVADMSNNTYYNFTRTFTTSDCGTISFSITANDTNGDSTTNSSSFTVTGCTTSGTSGGAGGGGGGGGGGASSPALAPILEEEDGNGAVIEFIPSASPTEPIAIIVDEAGLAVSSIVIELNNEVTDIEVSVETLETKPVEIAEPDRQVYEYISIEANGLNSNDINSADINFRVETSWIEENNIDQESVTLLRYNEGWQELETQFISKSDQTFLYESKTPGFSTFAIVGDEIIEETKEESSIKEVFKSKGFKIFSIIFAIVAILVLIFTILELRKHKKQTKSNNPNA